MLYNDMYIYIHVYTFIYIYHIIYPFTMIPTNGRRMSLHISGPDSVSDRSRTSAPSGTARQCRWAASAWWCPSKCSSLPHLQKFWD